MPYGSTSLEPMRAQTLCLLSAMGQVPTHVWVEEEGYKRRVKGKGKGGRCCLEHLLQTVDINGNHKRNKWKCEVTLSRSHSICLRQRPLPHPLNTHTNWAECSSTYSTLWFQDTMQVASIQTVLLWQLYMFMGTMYNSEDTCKTMLLHVRHIHLRATYKRNLLTVFPMMNKQEAVIASSVTMLSSWAAMWREHVRTGFTWPVQTGHTGWTSSGTPFYLFAFHCSGYNSLHCKHYYFQH